MKIYFFTFELYCSPGPDLTFLPHAQPKMHSAVGTSVTHLVSLRYKPQFSIPEDFSVSIPSIRSSNAHKIPPNL